MELQEVTELLQLLEFSLVLLTDLKVSVNVWEELELAMMPLITPRVSMEEPEFKV